MTKDKLLTEGFSQWNKRDFYKFINMCELFGRKNMELFSELLVGGKTLDEIKLYSEAFWANYKKIDKFEKYIERIEKGEQEIQKRQRIDQAIEDKFTQL
jgi:SWI/SNF-related matrix-associated actin-dependent regulator of chromatin subfamily A member 5